MFFIGFIISAIAALSAANTSSVSDAVYAICAEPRIVNSTSTWNKIDQGALNQAKKRCSSLYLNSPCLVEFRKKNTNQYHAICGKEQQ